LLNGSTDRLYRYAEQLRAAGLSISNNIAEGSGSVHKQALPPRPLESGELSKQVREILQAT
jgi:hypothetical protein